MSTGTPWRIELPGSEIARIETQGQDLVVVLAAARVSGDRRQTDPRLSGGHLLGVRWHLLRSRWTGEPSAMIGRIDEATWLHAPSSAQARGDIALIAPSSGDTALQLTLTSALGDTLEVQAQAWRVELLAGGRFTPSLAC